MLFIWILGFTRLLGGPYLFFKIIFWIALFPLLFTLFFLILIFLKTKKNFMVNRTDNRDQTTIHVEAKIKE